ncbi:MAG: hydroxymethylbilane synthase [candidate division Zixibacteria bacterium]|nr:hydroxymethylbilane synthase [candidate division Zixibacteria bacterium]
MRSKKIRIGTRGSKLALWQTNHVAGLLRDKYPDIEFKPVIIKTAGDTNRVTALDKIGGTGLFTKKIEQALLEGAVDIAVHSAKDLPSVMTAGLAVGAVPGRGPCEDVWLSRDNRKIQDIKPGAVVGSSSPRRRAQLLFVRPDLNGIDIRGNIETRIKKMQSGRYDALVMARAGLVRLGYDNFITTVLPPEDFVPAPGQGLLLVQVRADDEFYKKITQTIDNADARRVLNIERLLLSRLHAGCSTPVGGWARRVRQEIYLSAVVLDKSGTKRLYVTHKIDVAQSDDTLVDEVVRRLLAQGAGALIHA